MKILKSAKVLATLLLLQAVLLAACKAHRDGDLFLAHVGVTNVLFLASQATDAHLFDKGGEMPKALWPTSIQNTGVRKVQRLYSGVQLILTQTRRTQRGIYATTNLMEEVEDGSGISFTKLRPGLFWFEEKLRDVRLAEELIKRRTNANDPSTNGVVHDPNSR